MAGDLQNAGETPPAWKPQASGRRTAVVLGALGLVLSAEQAVYVYVYVVSDWVVALLLFVAVAAAFASGIALALRFVRWYEELMNKPWGKGKPGA